MRGALRASYGQRATAKQGRIVTMRTLATGLVIAVALVAGACSGSDGGDEGLTDLMAQPDIFSAALAGDLEQVQALMAENWDPAQLSPDGETPLTAAAKGGNPDIVRLMVQYGASPSQQNLNKVTPLQAAEKAGNKEAAQVLRELGATE